MIFMWTYILNIRIIISLIIFNIEGFPEAKHGVILLKASRNDIVMTSTHIHTMWVYEIMNPFLSGSIIYDHIIHIDSYLTGLYFWGVGILQIMKANLQKLRCFSSTIPTGRPSPTPLSRQIASCQLQVQACQMLRHGSVVVYNIIRTVWLTWWIRCRKKNNLCSISISHN